MLLAWKLFKIRGFSISTKSKTVHIIKNNPPKGSDTAELMRKLGDSELKSNDQISKFDRSADAYSIGHKPVANKND